MYVYKALAGFSLDFNGYQFNVREGDRFLFADDVFDLLPEKTKKLFVRTDSRLPSFYKGEPLNGKHLVVIAQAAIGDALCMTPALRAIKEKYPDMRLSVSISGKARVALENLDYIDELLPMPVPFKKIRKAHYLVKAVEMVGTPEFDNLGLVDFYLWKLRLYHVDNKLPDVYVDKEAVKEMSPIVEEIKRISGKKKVLIFHYLASSIHRILPPKLLKDIEELAKNEYVPVICSLPSEDVTVEVSLDIYGIRAANLSSYMKDFKYLVAMIYLADAVITTDTATLHIAAGLKKPTVLVSGPIDPDFTAADYVTVIPVRARYRGKTCVAPCRIHATAGPCPEALSKGSFYSPCLESIPAEVIWQALKDAEKLTQASPASLECPVCKSQEKSVLFEAINGYYVRECPSCGLQFADPMQSMDYEKAYREGTEGLLKFAEKFYESLDFSAKDVDSIVSGWRKLPRINVILPILSVLPKGKLLDVGCATGYFMLIARRLGYEVYGLEISEKAVKTARENFGLKVFQAASLSEVPVDFKGPYRVITALEFIEHLEDPMSFLRQAFDMLEDEGYLFVSFPSFYKFENLAKKYQKYRWWFGDYPPNHLTRWKPWTLHYALKEVGFAQVHLFTEPFLPGTLFEGVTPIPFVVKFKEEQQAINVPADVTAKYLMEIMKPLYLNAPNLGNFQFAIAVKKYTNYDLEALIKKAIRFSAIETIWREDH